MPIVPEYFQALARYNQWANRRLYHAVGMLDDGQWAVDRGAYFGSLKGTLNHLVVADTIWLDRIEGHPNPNMPLDSILHEALGPLREARDALDTRFVQLALRLERDDLNDTVTYRNSSGEAHQTPLAWILAHMVNHQTHHRGQAHTLLSQSGMAPPPLDLIFYLREIGAPPL